MENSITATYGSIMPQRSSKSWLLQRMKQQEPRKAMAMEIKQGCGILVYDQVNVSSKDVIGQHERRCRYSQRYGNNVLTAERKKMRVRTKRMWMVLIYQQTWTKASPHIISFSSLILDIQKFDNMNQNLNACSS